MVGPLVSNIDAANANSAAIHIDMQTAAPFTDEDSDSSVEEEDIIPRFVKWRARKGAAATLGDALYGFGSKEDVRVGRMKIDVSTSAKRGWGKGGQAAQCICVSFDDFLRTLTLSFTPSFFFVFVVFVSTSLFSSGAYHHNVWWEAITLRPSYSQNLTHTCRWNRPRR